MDTLANTMAAPPVAPDVPPLDRAQQRAQYAEVIAAAARSATAAFRETLATLAIPVATVSAEYGPFMAEIGYSGPLNRESVRVWVPRRAADVVMWTTEAGVGWGDDAGAIATATDLARVISAIARVAQVQFVVAAD